MGPKKAIVNKQKRKTVRTTIELKKEIIEKYESGVRVTNLATQFNLPRSTISTFLKNKEAIKNASVARGVTSLTKRRPPIIDEVEKLLLVWIKQKQLLGDSITEATICAKARTLYTDLMKSKPELGSGPEHEFLASRGWFDRFRKRSGIHSVAWHGGVGNADEKPAEKYVKDFHQFIDKNDLTPSQTFSCSGTKVFWKKIPKKTYITDPEVEKIVTVTKSTGLEVSSGDYEEMIEEHSSEIKIEELQDKQQILTEELPGEEFTRESASSEIKEMLFHWEKFKEFFQKYHHDKELISYVTDIVEDNVVNPFRKQIKEQIFEESQLGSYEKG